MLRSNSFIKKRPSFWNLEEKQFLQEVLLLAFTVQKKYYEGHLTAIVKYLCLLSNF